ncbi:MAG: efflux RND transporter periplasmic adaptor subunit [Prolixibacteraceae bacterium]|jgi:membrane fusion protein (multidrug efflux system)|nr:efflux RND transporter periplasmic adaptor subunit [Prolixibacteraceae bacterium]
MLKYFLLSFALVILFYSCKPKQKEPKNLEKSAYLEDKNQVEIIVLDKSTFSKQLVSNGKLNALRKSELKFQSSGVLDQINVKNGGRIIKGEVIASIQDDNLQLQLQQSKTNLEKAKLEFQDVLIGMGYELKDSAQIPADKMQLARIKSGYTNALNNLETAYIALSDCELKAPFDGLVANIEQKCFEETNGKAFCTLIDDSKFEVTFQVLETELKDIPREGIVKIIPYSIEDTLFIGTVSEINPVVDQNGLIQVRALVDNHGQLIEGMNVKVLIEKDVTGQYVVPKAAVVLRDNWEVLFKVVNGKAYWNYVLTTNENTTSYTVIPNPEKSSATLVTGDTIIISDNLNLAHESDVEIKN